jgi:hypothetical protein
MLHLPPAHHKTSKHDSPNETKVKEKQNETIPDSNSNLDKSMTHHNQTKELTTWFLNLPKIQNGYDSIWVIVDRLSKVVHFIPVKTTYKGSKLAELYIARIVCLHGVPKKIVYEKGTQFTSKFWEKLHESMDTKLNFSSAYHPQTDGQTERVNQILEDMLRACALKDNQSWDKCLSYAEFSYNNSYQESIKMAPFEFLYGRKCRTPLFWNEPSENQIFEPDILWGAKRQVQMVRENLKLAQSKQKSYVDN